MFLCGIAGLFAWSLSLEHYWATKILLALLFVGMIFEIVRYAGNPQQRISSFMESLPVSSDLPVLILPAKDEAELMFRRFTEIIRQIRTFCRCHQSSGCSAAGVRPQRTC
jgi:hypothetical protein